MDSIQTREDIWTKIHPTLKRIFETNSYSLKDYSYIFTIVYNSIVNTSSHARKIKEMYRRKWQLYLKLENFFTSFCNSLFEKSADLEDEDFLRFISTEWQKYEKNCHFLKCTFNQVYDKYLGAKQYVYNESHPIIYKISVLATITWKSTFLDKHYHKMIETASKFINLHRQGKTIDCSLIFNVVKCYEKVRIYEDVRENYFETLLLKDAEKFYDLESTALFNDNSTVEYIKKVEERFQDERKIFSSYFHSSSKENLIKLFQRMFIDRYLEFFYAEFKNFLTWEKYDDIKLMYSGVLIYVKDLSKYVEFFEKHIFDQGLASVEGCGESVENNPKVFIDAILVVYKKYINLIKNAFSYDQLFNTGLEQAIKRLVNENLPKRVHQVSDLITNYCDQVLSKSDSNQNEDLEEVLNDVSIVFYFIKNKDIFQMQYMKLLTRRLVNNLSKSVELESVMIEKMRDISNINFMTKFMVMLKDIKLSRDINQEFAQINREPLDLDCNVMVLRSSSWPFPTSSTLTLPLQLQKCVSQFTAFYDNKHERKKLSWVHNISSGEILTKNLNSCYTIQASTPQIVILLLFNRSPAWTVAKIQEETGINLNIIVQNILIMLKAKLLTYSDRVEYLTKDSMICINPSYNNKKPCININVHLKIKSKEKASDKTIDERRKFIIQATIVRIMKSRKTLKNKELLSEVILNLSSKFKPKTEMITKCIRHLVDRQFMEYSSTDANTLNYLA